MASFRAITGQEEAATALMMAIQAKRYPGATKFRAWNHHHKAAVLACVVAIVPEIQPIIQEYRLTFDFEKGRIDIMVPLSNFGVRGGEEVGLQFDEPLGQLHSRKNEAGEEVGDAVFVDALDKMAEGEGFENARKFISDQANARNTLLYASDQGLPESKAGTEKSLANRKVKSLTLLTLAVMVLQAKKAPADGPAGNSCISQRH